MKNAVFKELERLLNLSRQYLNLLKKKKKSRFLAFKRNILIKCSFLLRGINFMVFGHNIYQCLTLSLPESLLHCVLLIFVCKD